jgi:hypothetical protein
MRTSRPDPQPDGRFLPANLLGQDSTFPAAYPTARSRLVLVVASR